MKISFKPMLKISVLTLALCGVIISSINAQTKPAQKQVKKDSVKKEVPAKAVKDSKKNQKAPAAAVAPVAQPAKKH